MKKLLFLGLVVLASLAGRAQKDTIVLNSKNINIRALMPGVNRYLVYFKNGKDSSRIKYQFWTRKVDFISYRGRKAISIQQEWEDNDTVFHTVSSICDGQTFAPLYQETWWKPAGAFSFDFIEQRAVVQNKPLSATDTSAARKKVLSAFIAATSQEVFNWHLDLEVFALLPFKENTTYAINFYDPGLAAPQVQYYTIAGSGMLNGYDNRSIECWLLTHGAGSNSETFWISKKTKEVLKLEQAFNGKYRYKVKLPFAS